MNDDHQHHSFVHRVELWVDDLAAAERQWGPVLPALGCAPFQQEVVYDEAPAEA